MTIRQSLLPVAALAAAFCFSAQAQAKSVGIQCKTSANRAKVEVEGYQLTPGWYTAMISSGDGAHQVTAPAEYAEWDDDEGPKDENVDFEFDSKPAEVRDGDTEIAADFVVNGKVTAVLMDSSGAEVARATKQCKQKG